MMSTCESKWALQGHHPEGFREQLGGILRWWPGREECARADIISLAFEGSSFQETDVTVYSLWQGSGSVLGHQEPSATVSDYSSVGEQLRVGV